MQKIAFPLGIALALTLLTATSPADFVLTQENTALQTFNGSSGTKTVTFDNSLFPADPTILDIEVSITFSKLKNDNNFPFYNEVSFSLSKNEVPTSVLITSGTAVPTYTGSFTSGFIGDAGFDGTLVFKQSAATVVNSNPNKIVAGTYKPVGTLASFIGASGSGTYTLNIGDNGAGANTGLVFKKFSVSITAVPEPSSFACLGLLTTAGAFIRRRRSR